MAKKMIEECLERLDTERFEGPIDHVIRLIVNMRAESHAKGYSNLRFVADWGYEGIDAYELWGSRKETQGAAEEREERKVFDSKRRLRDLHQQELAERLARMTNDQIIQCLNIAVDVEPEEEEDE